MKTRFTKALIALLAIGTLAACGNNQTSSETPSGTPSETPEANPLAGTYDVKVWAAEAITELTTTQIAEFEAANPGIVINETVQAVGEGEAATQMVNDVEAGADIFCFAQDQFARLVQAGALTKLGQKTAATVSERNDAGSVNAVTSEGNLFAYPLTSDNGYFMYYDKSVVAENHVDSLEDIIADCEAANRLFSFELEGSAWYAASFFFATGCKSEWTADSEGKFTSVYDTFNSANGLVAVKGMQKLVTSKAYNNSSATSEFTAATPSAVVVSGTWDYATAAAALGDNLGVADLPSFTVDGNSYHLGSYAGFKLLGVRPTTDAKRAAVLQQLALYLTDAKCQEQRFDSNAWGPSNKVVQAMDKVKANPALAALQAQNAHSTPQGQIHGSWWDIGKAIATGVKAAKDDAELQTVLDTYKAAVDGVLAMPDEVRNAWTVIGAINGTTWNTDFEMEEVETGVWKTKEAYTLTAGTEFKVRKGLSWDEAWPAANFVVEADGTYYIVLTLDAEGNGTVTLEAA